MDAPPKSSQVSPLPIGSGGSNSTKRELNDVNVTLSMLSAQSEADQKFDPPPPTPVKPSIVKEAFRNGDRSVDLPFVLSVAGVACIVYGLVAK
jgi:hypothetical protein